MYFDNSSFCKKLNTFITEFVFVRGSFDWTIHCQRVFNSFIINQIQEYKNANNRFYLTFELCCIRDFAKFCQSFKQNSIRIVKFKIKFYVQWDRWLTCLQSEEGYCWRKPNWYFISIEPSFPGCPVIVTHSLEQQISEQNVEDM